LRHQEVEAVAEHFVAFVPSQPEEAVIGENDRIALRLRVHEHHRHSRFFGGDNERTALFAKVLDLAFGGRLLVGFLLGHVD
jgi:hypothetical protein